MSEIGFFHPDRGYWQAIDVSKEPYLVEVEPERVEVDDEGNETTIPAVTRETSQFAELMATYPSGTVEVPLPPGGDYEWQDGEWVHVPQPVDVPEVISDRQFFQALAKSPYLLISEAEALAAVKTGEIPAAMQVILDQVPPESKFDAEMLLSGATEFKRSNPLVATFAAALGWTDTQADQFWIFAHSL